MPLLQLKNINKFYGRAHILKDISFDITNGEFLTLLGPSGCGKTTVLRCIAGLENVDSGDILLNGKSIKELPASRRNVNTVFQNYALFPHLNVYDNIAYGPRVKKTLNERQLKTRVNDVLELVKMTGYEERMTHQLSGGQRQRIAIARALINEPDILLLDEPLGALDLKLRKHMQTELAHLQRQANVTFVYVTHDQEEALNMSDRIVVMNEGEIQQLGDPAEIYNNPGNLFVADFIGDRNIMNVEVLKGNGGYCKIKMGENTINVRSSPLKIGRIAVLAIHMDKMKIDREPVPNSLKGQVISLHYAGSRIKTEVDVQGETITVIEYQKRDWDYKVGDTAYIHWEESGAILLPRGERGRSSDE